MTSSDAPTIATTTPSASTIGSSRTQIRTGVPSRRSTVKSPSQAPPAFTSREDRRGAVLLGGGHQHVGDGLAQHLVSGPPVQLLGLLVPQEDASVGVGDDDRPWEGVDHRPKVQRRILLHRQVAHRWTPVGPGAADDAARPPTRKPWSSHPCAFAVPIGPCVTYCSRYGTGHAEPTLSASWLSATGSPGAGASSRSPRARGCGSGRRSGARHQVPR